MHKIPTLFKRDPDDMRRVLPEITPGCEWVLAGEGVPTRKYDGTCVMFDGLQWWARREVKQGRPYPPVFRLVDFDSFTGKSVGWEPVEQSPFAKFYRQAVIAVDEDSPMPVEWEEGTYELIGPKINGNPERRLVHTLVRHADAEIIEPLYLPSDPLQAYGALAEVLSTLGNQGAEGIVWHHSDGRMVKLKARDFR